MSAGKPSSQATPETEESTTKQRRQTSYRGNATRERERARARERKKNLHLETNPAAVFGILHFGSALQSVILHSSRASHVVIYTTFTTSIKHIHRRNDFKTSSPILVFCSCDNSFLFSRAGGKTPPRVLHLGCEFVLQFRHSGCARGLAAFSQLATSTKQRTEIPRKWPTLSFSQTDQHWYAFKTLHCDDLKRSSKQ